MSRNPLGWIDEELAALEAQHLRRSLAVRTSPQDPARIVVDGRALINFASNDYLALAADQRLVRAAGEAAEKCGWGAGASPLITGRGETHARLETELARLEHAEAALLFTTGFAANVGAIASLVGRGDAVYSDANNHASIIDGCRLSRADVQVYRHRDVDHLAELLGQGGVFRRRLIVTDSLFSMDGDLAPLPKLAEIAERHGAMLMVDEAHATGVFGPSGAGLCEQMQVESGVHVRVGTLSKALGSLGGFVAGSRQLVDWLTNRARGYFFSTAPPEPVAAASLAALNIVRSEPERRMRLLLQAENLRERLRGMGFEVGDSQSQIIPLYVGKPERAMQLAAALKEQGVFAPGIRPPSVPPGNSLVRISLSSAHDDAMIDRLVEALQKAK